MINTQRLRGALIEQGDYVVVDGVWWRLDVRTPTNPCQWVQRFEATRKNGEKSVVKLPYHLSFQVYRENGV